MKFLPCRWCDSKEIRQQVGTRHAICGKCGKLFACRLHMGQILELIRATPDDVWLEYFMNGYTLEEAVMEEFSYA